MNSLDSIAAQLSPANLLHEGADHVCNLLQQTIGANTVIPVTHTYWYNSEPFPSLDNLGTDWVDHGKPLPESWPDEPEHLAWVPYRERHYHHTPLRHLRPADATSDTGPDVLAELIPEARKRGMRVIPRVLEGMSSWILRRMPGWTQVCTVDSAGRRGSVPCWRHPDWRAFWLATIEDLFVNYHLDGLLLGAERGGPLGPMLNEGSNTACFCRYCRDAARERGIDVASAREGYSRMATLMAGLDAGDAPREGVLVSLMRLWLDHPEILAWHRLDVDGKQSLEAEIYGSVHQLRPGAMVGWFIPTYALHYDLFNRADLDYARMAAYSDFYRPALYDAVMGRRLDHWLRQGGGQRLWHGVPRASLLSLVYAMMGVDEAIMPTEDQLADQGFGETWIRREVRRCIDESKGRVACWPAMGIGVGGPRNDGNPEELADMIAAAVEEGASGLIVGRYYKEMSMDFLHHAGRAIREATTS